MARIKPDDPARFVRQEPILCENGSNAEMLQNTVRLTDEIFDHLSVFEQFAETTSRGAVPDPKKRLDLPNIRAQILKAQRELWDVYTALKDRRTTFVREQLQATGINSGTKGLKVQIGSAGHVLQDWLNIDAGGANLMLNVNWGLQLPDESAAFVYSAHLLEHLRFNDQAPAFLREVHRVLAKGGTVRLVVPDLKKLFAAYVEGDREFFDARKAFYPIEDGFEQHGVATLDYVLLYAGAGPQVLSYDHKFGYDASTLSKLLKDAGFSSTKECRYQRSTHPELRVDDHSYNARARYRDDRHYSLFVEATK